MGGGEDEALVEKRSSAAAHVPILVGDVELDLEGKLTQRGVDAADDELGGRKGDAVRDREEAEDERHARPVGFTSFVSETDRSNELEMTPLCLDGVWPARCLEKGFFLGYPVQLDSAF
ncbi:hypothetical protein L596_015338 [Steinernema carpocapsae]|uniref:Uncharacterized protein n=1 Tax=Steinernema carpocapsae TaxID=34508 RepID=A0A4U5NF98_STECR|nr:hypothetical protein L596_015338 [Steinernema carpocapsae]